MIKYTKILLYLLLITLVVQACSRGKLTSYESADTVVMSMGITVQGTVAKSSSSDLLLGDGESTISTVRIYAFNADNTLDVMKVFNLSTAMTTVILEDIEMLADANKQIFIVANEPSNLTSALNAVSTPEELRDINYTIASGLNAGFVASSTFDSDDISIPMTCTEVINATVDATVNFSLLRAVARVDLMLDKSANAEDYIVKLTKEVTFTVNGLTYTSQFIGGDIPSVSVSDVESLKLNASEVVLGVKDNDFTTAKRVLSFYVTEREYSASDDATSIQIALSSINVDGVEVALTTNSVTLGVGTYVTSELTSLQRNYVYRIYATYNAQDKALEEDNFVIQDWESVVLDGDIEGVTVSVVSAVAMDWLRNGNTFVVDPIAFGSNKPVTIYLPVALEEANSDGLLYDFVEVDCDYYSQGENGYDLLNYPLDDSYIKTIPWIESATLFFTSPYVGYVNYVYKATAVNYLCQKYPIRIKAGNVVKEMTAIYDNGYIAATELSATWRASAPYGVVVAKRGRAQHPTEVSDIYYRDADGYYRGEHTVAAEETDTYCKTELGPQWYAPSDAQLKEIFALRDEMGVSYRFQNTGSDYGEEPTSSFYWSTTQDEGSGRYWGSDFFNFTSYTAAASESNFVRCVLNL